MEILLSFLLMFWGGTEVDTGNADLNMLKEAVQEVRAQQNSETDIELPQDVNIGTDHWIKRDPQETTAPKIRGLFATGYTAGGGSKLDNILQLIDETDLNALVIDIKEDAGYITFDTGNPNLAKYNSTKPMIRDIEALMKRLEEHDVYPIARIVVFKDKVTPKENPHWTFKNPNGTIWANANKDQFVNPYVEEIWEYNIEVAKEAAKVGFKEIQFDYVRFPEGFETRADQLIYKQDERTRSEAVTDFVEYARKELNPLGVRVSVDIFGYAASAPAGGIGQDFNDISKYVDVISPMVYPSHYSTGWFGAKVPDAEPYTTIYGSMIDTHKKLEAIGDYKPIIRPWIQDFTASWIPGYIPYGKHEIEEQIRALIDTGIEEFLLWNASNVFTEDVDYTLSGS